MRTCQKCGAEVEKDDKFCPECGENVVKETRTITVSTVFKTIAMIIFFIILVNVLKSSNVVMSIPVILFGILFIVWAGILNSILKKLFNAEISTGVKIVITIVIVLIFLIGMRQASTIKVAPTMVRPIEGNDMSSFIDRLNNVMNTRDYKMLTAMMEEGTITPEVTEDIRILINNQKDFNINFKFQSQNVNDNKIDVNVMVIIQTLYEQRIEGVQFFFERTDRGWMLVAIEPRLSNLKISKSFEEETDYKIKQIPQPTDMNKQLVVKIMPDGTKERYY